MSKILIAGDLHAKYQQYADILTTEQPIRSIQIGDFGWGFYPNSRKEATIDKFMTDMVGDHMYFRGNHDDPAACEQHALCLPDVHYEADTDLMVVAGANSIDFAIRTQGFDWWEDEELSYDQLFQAIDAYEASLPRIMLTHDCPESIVGRLIPWYRADFKSRTREALDSMFAIHHPDVWIFGHHHKHVDEVINGTRFICLDELQTLKIDTDTLDIIYPSK